MKYSPPVRISPKHWLAVRQGLASLFILVLLLVSIVQMSPQCYLRDRILSGAAVPLRFLGLQQLWGVFGPEVPDVNRHLVAVVAMKDGTQALWDFPRMEKLDLQRRAHDEYFRKWANDNLPQDYLQFLRLDAARFVARRFSNESNEPVTISILSQEQPISSPDIFAYPQRRGPRTFCLFTYDARREAHK